MEYSYVIASFVLIPFLGFILSIFLPAKDEKILSSNAYFTVLVSGLVLLVFTFIWIIKGAEPLNVPELVLYKSKDYVFLIDFYFDKITAVYLLVGHFITLLICRFSFTYLHLEEGYRRFFYTILLFFIGYCFTILAGNFETLFIGWEILGISSFLLIAFYRDRYLPVRNAVKVFSVYRMGDIGILLAMWASHHCWHQNIAFFQFESLVASAATDAFHSWMIVFIVLCIILAASAKSAQFPFSYWLPRAMEGPTPSSAIFYGSLSVHIGVFLMLRTFPLWEHIYAIRWMVGGLGLLTAVIAFFITRVQTTIKTQIAYASITQIGIMFIEIALGLEVLVLVHFAGNAFLRTYQLLLSPSVVSYKIRDQLYHFQPSEKSKWTGIYKRVMITLYVLSIKEWGLDKIVKQLVFTPIKKLGRSLAFINQRNVLPIFIGLMLISVVVYFIEMKYPGILNNYLPEALAIIGLLFVFKAFAERFSPVLSWILVCINHAFVALAVTFNEHFSSSQTMIYLSGIVVAGTGGYLILKRLSIKEQSYFDLNQYYGHIYEYPKTAMLFLISALGVMGFPITPTFLGEDLIFSHIHEHQYVLASSFALSFIVAGMALIRIYARLFLGPHIKATHETPLTSS